MFDLENQPVFLLGVVSQQQLQKQRLVGKYDPMVGGTYNLLMNLNSNSIINQQLQPHLQQQSQNTTPSTGQQPNRLPNQFSHSSSVDDELGLWMEFTLYLLSSQIGEKQIYKKFHYSSDMVIFRLFKFFSFRF